MNPIWKKTTINIPGASAGVPYTVKDGDTVIYSGRAFSAPGESSALILLNPICADRLSSPRPDLTNVGDDQPAALSKTFTFVTGLLERQESFVYDYSYDKEEHLTGGRNRPIVSRVSRYLPLCITGTAGTNATALIYDQEGTLLDDMPHTFSMDGHYLLDIESIVGTFGDNVGYIDIGGHRYTLSDGCEGMVLLYRNKLGGWDELIPATIKRSDSLTRKTHTRATMSSEESEKVEYRNDATATYTMTSGWLNDAESSRMPHLLGTTEACLVNVVTGEVLPCILKDTTIEHKTYKTNGGKLVDYTFSAEVAYNYTRR